MGTFFNRLPERYIALIAFLLSFCLSPWAYHPWNILNSDGILYLHLAYIVNTQGISAAFVHYDWPFFSICIAIMQKITHLSYVNSAYILDTIFMSFSAFFFVKITKLLGASKLTQWMAVLVFLSFETIINYRINIFRDIGYWAFYLSALFFYFQFAEKQTVKFGLFYFFSMLSAVLFRIEGTSILIITPFVVFFFKNLTIKEKLIAYIKLNLPLFIIAPCIFLAIIYIYFIKNINVISIIEHQLAVLVTTHLHTVSLTHHFHDEVVRFRQILPKAAKDGSAQMILFFGLTGYFLCKFIWVMGGLNFILLIGSLKSKLIRFKSNQKIIFFVFLATTLLVPYNFLLQNLFISTRYMTSGAITALLLAPFALSYCFTYVTQKNNFSHKVLTFKVFFIIYLICAVGDFIFLEVVMFYKKNSNLVYANLWLHKHRSELTNVCSNNSWPVFATIGEKVSDAQFATSSDIAHVQVDSSLALLVAPTNQCDYIVYIQTPSHKEQANYVYSLMQAGNVWKLYKVFPSQKEGRNIFVLKKINLLCPYYSKTLKNSSQHPLIDLNKT